MNEDKTSPDVSHGYIILSFTLRKQHKAERVSEWSAEGRPKEKEVRNLKEEVRNLKEHEYVMRMFSVVGSTTDELVPMNSMKKEVQAVTPRIVEHQRIRFHVAEATTVDSKATKRVRENALKWADSCSNKSL
jgi:hypothetical protein